MKIILDYLQCPEVGFFLPPHTSEFLGPAVVTISESGQSSVRVSWGPLQPETVTSYYIEYSALPMGKLHALTVGRTQNSTLLRHLQPDTTYLVTVTARYTSGKEKAMSVKVCTQEGETCEGNAVQPVKPGSVFCTLNLSLQLSIFCILVFR